MKHVMVDIETLGTKPGSVILSIGAVRFDETGVAADKFYRPVDVFDSLMAGLKVDEPTIGFWRLQPFEAVAPLTPGRPLRETLLALSAYIKAVENTYVWAKGPDFDCVLIEAAYQAIGMKRPWRYNMARDVRTILGLTPGAAATVERSRFTEHHALGDAQYQAECVIAAANGLGVVLSEMAA